MLAKHWPGVPIFEDIHNLKRKQLDALGRIDFVTGGFPCQPFSAAGKRRGAQDDRHLWPQMLRVIVEAQPAWIVGENVAHLLSMVEFDGILFDLESAGYEVLPFVFPACAVGAKHKRERIFIVAHSESIIRLDERRRFRGAGKGASQPERSLQAHVAHADGERRKTTQGLETRDPYRSDRIVGSGEAAPANGNESRKRLTESARRAEPVFPGWWQSESGICRVADGVPCRVDRLRGLGNAVVPQQIYPILAAIQGIAA